MILLKLWAYCIIYTISFVVTLALCSYRLLTWHSKGYHASSKNKSDVLLQRGFYEKGILSVLNLASIVLHFLSPFLLQCMHFST